MSDTTNDIDALLRYLDGGASPWWGDSVRALVAERDALKEMHAHLGQSYTMLAKECDALKQRVAELEYPIRNPLSRALELEQALAAMRKGDSHE